MALQNMFPAGQSMRVSFGVSGLPELLNQLERLRKIAPGECAERVREVAIDIQREARKNITAQGAVDTGLTRANILQWSDDAYRTASIGVSSTKVAVTHRTVGKRSFFRNDKNQIALIAAVIEFGHGVIRPVRAKMLRWFDKSGNPIFARQVRAMPPRPFLYPAYEAGIRDMTKKIKDSILSIVKRTG
jgi:hypothetical protein